MLSASTRDSWWRPYPLQELDYHFRWMAAVGALLLVGLIEAGLRITPRQPVAIAFLVPAVLFLVGWNWMMWRGVRTGVWVRRSGIRIRTLDTITVLPWSDVTEIRSEPAYGRGLMGLPAIWIVTVDGERVRTPLLREDGPLSRRPGGLLMKPSTYDAVLELLHEELRRSRGGPTPG
jgi:hypothetical protein